MPPLLLWLALEGRPDGRPWGRALSRIAPAGGSTVAGRLTIAPRARFLTPRRCCAGPPPCRLVTPARSLRGLQPSPAATFRCGFAAVTGQW